MTPLTEPEARMLTAKAVTTANALAHLLKQLHDGQAHKALGYNTWSAYCAAHFDESLRTIQRYIRQERVREAIAGSVNVSRFTNGALEALATVPADLMCQVGEVAADNGGGSVSVEAVKASYATISETLRLGAVTLADGSQVPVKEALADGVRGTLREDMLSKREYLAANIEAHVVDKYFHRIQLNVSIPGESVAPVTVGDTVRISIWREQPNER